MNGLRLNNIRLYGGKIAITGLDAVVAEFGQATLERRGDDGSAGPIWTLHAFLSYQNDFFLKSQAFEKKVLLEPFKDQIYQAVEQPGVEWNLENDVLIIEGVTLCPVEPKSQS